MVPFDEDEITSDEWFDAKPTEIIWAVAIILIGFAALLWFSLR